MTPPADLAELRELVEAVDRTLNDPCLLGLHTDEPECRFCQIRVALDSALPAAREALERVENISQERDRLQQWVHDLQRGMYINCVYCGHRYGPDDEVPATMAQALKDHIEQCRKHPMGALKTRIARLEEALAWALDTLRTNDAFIQARLPDVWKTLNEPIDIAAKKKALAALEGRDEGSHRGGGAYWG